MGQSKKRNILEPSKEQQSNDGKKVQKTTKKLFFIQMFQIRRKKLDTEIRTIRAKSLQGKKLKQKRKKRLQRNILETNS